MKKIQLTLLMLCATFLVHAQSNQKDTLQKEQPIYDNLHFTASIQTNHIWRGLIITDKPVIAGQVWYDLNQSKTLQVGVWGAAAISNDSDGSYYKEIDYYIQFAKNGFTIGIWDLFNSRGIDPAVASDEVFNYSQKRTTHIIDLRMSYRFQHNFPLRLEADVMLYGGANAGEVLLDSYGDYDANRYSTYVEASYPVIDKQNISLNAFVGGGFAFNPGDKGATYLYGNGQHTFDIVNVGFTVTKNLPVFDTHIPVSFSTFWNPSQNFARVQLATTLF